MLEIDGKHAELMLERPDKLLSIARALSSPVRLNILSALNDCSMSVGELAKKLDVPMSTMALAVRTLEEADLIICDIQPGSHGSTKICSRKLDTIAITLVSNHVRSGPQPLTLTMPIGGYSVAEGIHPTCGMLSAVQPLGALDSPRIFYSPNRFDAQLIWFQQGFLEYRFSFSDHVIEEDIEWLELSFEACSEAPMYRDPWPSDIYVEINQKKIGTWTCPSDCGGRQGNLTPEWWTLANTQYGFLKTWRIDNTGSYLDHIKISDTTTSDLKLVEHSFIRVRIGVDPDSEHPNGINLFGEKFGDHPQSINLKIGFRV